MTPEERRRWNSRPTEVRVLDRCDECETLKPDVKERQSYYPHMKITCCGACFAQLANQHEGIC